jgi:tetratricopeptide (TPR) repeat protein
MIKKIVILCCFFVGTQVVFSQTAGIDTALKRIALEKDESKRIDLVLGLFATVQESDPAMDMEYAKQLLQQSHDIEDPVGEALALSEIGYAYRGFGNIINGLDYNIKSLAIAEKTGNAELIAAVKINLAMYYKDLAEYPKALGLLLPAETESQKAKSYKIQSWALMNLGEVYIAMNKPDSAWIYSQRAYTLCMQINYKDFLSFICLQLGRVHGKLSNAKVATGFYELAIEEAVKVRSPKYLNQAYYALAQYYNDTGQNDSCVAYAVKAIAATQNTAFSNMNIKPAKLLSGIYENSNSDSTVKYLKMYQQANDSLFSKESIQRAQVLTFENELRQQELAEEKEQAEENRQQNIQYALIALGIVCFIIIFLLFSRSIIANSKIIEFLSVIALLLVFEFLNLLLHPYITKVTHHSPPLTLLAMVCIAALLVPVHHKIEKWTTAKLVEKNKQIRLAAARKTIEKLEGRSTGS